MVRLSVNVNKVATLRNARGGNLPSVVEAARTAVEAGAHGITVHPRPDERHIRRRDVLDLAAVTTDLGVEFNIEGYPSAEFLDLILQVLPAQCTLVPDPPGVLTSNAGWQLGQAEWLRPVLDRLRAAGVRSSLFLDTELDEVRRARELGADCLELYTERYARCYSGPERQPVFGDYRKAAQAAVNLGLGVNAGHDLNLENLPLMARELPGLQEVSIGHALIADALYMGLRAAVKAYLAALEPKGQ
ncbi:MAG: pyridoxine 5'-phosphate synthase [Acidobacteriota bacterium]